MEIYKLHLDLSGVPKINHIGETIQGKFFKVLNLGYRKFFIDPSTKDLIEPNCLENNIPLVQCKTGLELLTDKVFRGFFKIKEALSPDEAIITAIDIDGNEDVRDYVLKKYNDTTILYEQSPYNAHREIFVVEDGIILKRFSQK